MKNGNVCRFLLQHSMEKKPKKTANKMKQSTDSFLSFPKYKKITTWVMMLSDVLIRQGSCQRPHSLYLNNHQQSMPQWAYPHTNLGWYPLHFSQTNPVVLGNHQRWFEIHLEMAIQIEYQNWMSKYDECSIIAIAFSLFTLPAPMTAEL